MSIIVHVSMWSGGVDSGSCDLRCCANGGSAAAGIGRYNASHMV